MQLEDCLKNVYSKTVIRGYATGIIENRKEKNIDEIEKELLHQIDTIRARTRNNLHILEKSRSKRLLKPIILKIILEERNYQIKIRELSEDVKAFETEIIESAKTTDFFAKKELKSYEFDIYYTILKGAWEKDFDITEDEENILRALRKKMNITLEEHWMLQSKLGIFPKPTEDSNNRFHTSEDVQEITRILQSEQLLIQITGDDKEKYYIIPEEIAGVIKNEWDIQLSKHSYNTLLSNRKIFSKDNYLRILEIANIKSSSYKNDDLISTIIKTVKPMDVLLTFVPKDELTKELENACVEITGTKGSSKNDRIERIFGTLDEIAHKTPRCEDKRELYYKYYNELASRKHNELRTLKVIEKDLDIERAFEEATRYLFEIKLNHTLEEMPGSDHPDGRIIINDSTCLLWDNKSKEKACNLNSHLDQFHRYIRNEELNTQTFLVIAPEFDIKSSDVAHIQKAKNNKTFALVNASDLKAVAEDWAKSQHKSKQFPLSVFNIAGEMDSNGLKNAFKLV